MNINRSTPEPGNLIRFVNIASLSTIHPPRDGFCLILEVEEFYGLGITDPDPTDTILFYKIKILFGGTTEVTNISYRAIEKGSVVIYTNEQTS